jgi:hypothetical protein
VRSKADWKPPVFIGGPKLTDTSELDAWITKQRIKQPHVSIKLPFTIFAADRKAALGVVDDAAPDKRIRLDDGALGVSLDERIRMLCPDKPARCTLWLSGRFGTLLNKDEDPRRTFSVFAVHERIPADVDRASLRASVERHPDCLVIRSQKPLHCARGPKGCAKCKAADEQPAKPKLLDVCPDGDHARPTVILKRDGKETVRVYDILQSFESPEAAEEFAKKHGITDIIAR